MRKLLFITVLLFSQKILVAKGFTIIKPNSIDSFEVPLLTTKFASEQKLQLKINDTTQWLNAGSMPFANSRNIKMAVNSQNEIAVYFMDTLHQNKGTVKKIEGTDWINLGDSASLPMVAEIAFSPSGELYIAGYEDTSTRIKVLKFLNGNWQPVGNISSMPYGSTYSKLSFAGDGTLYVGFIVFDQVSSSSFPNVMRFNGVDWKHVGLPNFYTGGTNWFDFKLSPSDIPYIIMGDRSQPSLGMTCLKFEGNNWILVGPPGFSTCGNYVSIDFSTNGTPYVCGVERYNPGGNRWKAAVLKYDGTNWQKINGTYVSQDSAYYPKLLMSPTDEPIIVYGKFSLNSTQPYSTNYMLAKKFKNGVWEQIGSQIEEIQNTSSTSLTLTASGDLYVAFSSSSKATSFVKYLNAVVTPCNINNWTGAVDDSWGNPPNWTCGTVPASNTNIFISAGLARYPVLNSNASCNSLTVNVGANITVKTGFTLNILGN